MQNICHITAALYASIQKAGVGRSKENDKVSFYSENNTGEFRVELLDRTIENAPKPMRIVLFHFYG